MFCAVALRDGKFEIVSLISVTGVSELKEKQSKVPWFQKKNARAQATIAKAELLGERMTALGSYAHMLGRQVADIYARMPLSPKAALNSLARGPPLSQSRVYSSSHERTRAVAMPSLIILLSAVLGG